MMLKETLREIVKTQRNELYLFEKSIERESLKKMNVEIPFALVLSGIRRCGKSTLLRQLMKKARSFYYFNFEDPRAINFQVSDFQKLNEIFEEEYGNGGHYFFDEIQNVPKWELFVRALLDKKRHIVITGSNASLLSKELGTRLTGRHLRRELFPFSFNEFLKLINKKPGIKSFEEYFTDGGFPEYLKIKRAEILQELLNDILIRDIATRHKIRNVKTLREMALYLLTNAGKEFSYNNLKKMFNLGSTNSAISFVSYLEDSYLLFSVPKFDYSLKKQIVNPKKIYSIDNGLSNINSASFSQDKGKMLENMVFINLKREFKDIFYFQERGECDFVIKDGTKIMKAIQVCYNLNEDNKDREINGLAEALKKFGLQEGLILTYDQEDKFELGGKIIKVIPVWKWILT
ncbi:ATP-binding protein [Candidatus Pacearchaeota archaeon]|nr:ATP-binding protein [Candidatus Pacearchaeota archaeon]